MRVVAIVVILALSSAGFFIADAPTPQPGESPALGSALFAVCPVEEGSGRSTALTALSTVNGPVRLSLFDGGGGAGSIEVSTGASGSTVIPVVDVAAVGKVGGLVEVPIGTSAVGLVVRGADSISAESCTAATPPEMYLTGATSAAQAPLELHLMNPFSAESLVRLTVTSEAGVESNERFEAVVVPARDSRVIDLADLVPGRESISVGIQTLSGRVFTTARQGLGNDIAVWNALEPASDWFVPVPAGEFPKMLVLGNPGNIDVDYQLDVYGPAGVEEGFAAGVIPASGRLEVDVNGIGLETLGLRLITTTPVVPALVSRSETGVAATTGSAQPSTRWMLPGASIPEAGEASVVILNPGIEDVDVVVRPLREQSSQREFVIPADGVLEVGLEFADGFLVDASGPVVALWIVRTPTSSALAIGVPLDDE